MTNQHRDIEGFTTTLRERGPQPALTAPIKKLRVELSTQRFERLHVVATPTVASPQLYRDARKLL